MIFVTVGSSLPFDRLIRLVDEASEAGLLPDAAFAQIGQGSYTPRNLPYVRLLPKSRYEEHVLGSSAIISHAGIGTIRSALVAGKPILAMPRQKAFGEIVDDHQVATARRFAELGHILTFTDRLEFRACLDRLKVFVPAPRCPNAKGVAQKIGDYLADLETR